VRITLEIFVDYRSLDLVARSFGAELDEALKLSSLPPAPPPLLDFAMMDEAPADLNETIDEEQLEASLLGLRQTLSALEPVHILPLHEILVLRIENGHDFYLTVDAQFGPTPEGWL
jgi:hypothetical protein